MKRRLILFFFGVLLMVGKASHALSQEAEVRGKVLDGETGEGLPGATVKVKNRDIATATDHLGVFTLLSVPAGATLVISYIGYETEEVPVTQGEVEVRLQRIDTGLDEVIVVGYGAQKKASITGSVASVSSEILTERPAPNAANLLQGRVTGLQVTQPSGEPGRDNPNFLIRGRGSFGGSTAPLVLIDGVTGSINNLSPDDIENITVLKDAASASIYGARAANGVVLVTTKKGKRGGSTLSYRLNVGRHTPTSMPDFITNSAEYMEMYNQAAARSGLAFRYPDADIEAYRNATDRNRYPNFNAVDHYYNPASVVNHNLSLSGGNEKSTYNFSLGYLDQDAMLPVYNFKRYNVLLNYSTQVAKGVTIGSVVNGTFKNRKEPPFTSENMALLVYAAGPLYGPFLPDGSGRIVSRGYQNEGRNRNPEEVFGMGSQDTKEYNLNAQAYMDVSFLNKFTWSSKVAVNYVDEYYKMYQRNYDAYLLNEKDPATGDHVLSRFGPDILGVTDQYSKTITPTIYSTLSFDDRYGDHSVSALAGYEQLYYSHQNLRGRRQNSVSPVLTDLRGYTAANEALYFNHPRLPSLAGPSEWAMRSFFGRVNYDYKGKYFAEANLRYDGTSKVSPAYRWGVFPSFSAGWLMSEELFLQEKLPGLTTLKLRGSYGTLGNQDIGTYLYQDNLAINVNYPFDNQNLTQGAVINTYRDQSLRWESTSVLDLGLDLVIKKGLLSATFDWYRKTSFDILASQPVPGSLGLLQPTINNGRLRNQGIELELRHDYKLGNVRYGVFGQVSTARNKVLAISVPSYGNRIREEGTAYDAHYLYIWDGIFQEEDLEDPAVPRHAGNPNPRAGDLKMKDLNGDGVIDGDDRRVVEGVYPDYFYSFGFNVDYKGFNLSAFFQGVEGVQSRVNNWGVDPFMQGTAPTSKWRNAWTPENRSNTMPALYVAGYTGVAAYTNSTYFLQDASYLRLKNIMLSYSFPTSLLSRIGSKGLNVYVSAENLLTWTRYEGSDPERGSATGNFAQYPQAKIFNAGLNIKF